jgi:hypothetical protein
MHDKKQTPWPDSASEVYRPSDRRLSVKLVPTFADGGFRVVSTADHYGRNLELLDRNMQDGMEITHAATKRRRMKYHMLLLRNFGWRSTNYTAFYRIRQNSLAQYSDTAG